MQEQRLLQERLFEERGTKMLYKWSFATEPDESAGVVIVAEGDSANEARQKAMAYAKAEGLPVLWELEWYEPDIADVVIVHT